MTATLDPSAPPFRRPLEPRFTRDQGHGHRLTAAFEALEGFPALGESRDRLLRLLDEPEFSAGDVVTAVESDLALTIGVLRLANQVARANRFARVPALRLPAPPCSRWPTRRGVAPCTDRGLAAA